MSYTFAQLQTAVLDNIGNRTDKTSVIQRGINFALKEIAKLHDWYCLRTTVDATINVNDDNTALAADFHKLIEARCINPSSTALSYPFQIIPMLEFVRRYPNVTAYGSGRPYIASEISKILYYFPKSSQSYTLRYTYNKLPADLTLDADIQPFVECDLPIVQWATHYVFGSIQMIDMASAWLSSYQMSIQESIRSEKRRIGNDIRMHEFNQKGGEVHGSPEPWLDPFSGR